MKKAFLALFAIFVVGEVSNLHAEEEKETGVYIHGFGGLNYLVTPSTENVRLDVKTGYALGGSLGYKFSKTMRLEGELSYRENLFDKFVVTADRKDYDIQVDGRLTKWACMGNMLFDMPFKLLSILDPYFGGGIGRRVDRGKIEFIDFADELEQSKFNIKGKGIAYQGIAGLSLQYFKNTDFRLEYRYLNSGDDADRSHTLALTCQQTF